MMTFSKETQISRFSNLCSEDEENINIGLQQHEIYVYKTGGQNKGNNKAGCVKLDSNRKLAA